MQKVSASLTRDNFLEACFLPQGNGVPFSRFRSQEHLDRKKRELQQKRAESEQARLQKLSDQFQLFNLAGKMAQQLKIRVCVEMNTRRTAPRVFPLVLFSF